MTSMARLIVDYNPVVISADAALRRVAEVVAQGRISEAAGVAHYCWVSTFAGGICVETRRKKQGQESDSFMVTEDYSRGYRD